MDYRSLIVSMSQITRFMILISFLFILSVYNLVGQEITSGNSGSEALIEKGIRLQDEGKFGDALACYRQVSKCDPNYPWSVFESAHTLNSNNKPEEALKKCDEALFLHHDVPQLYALKGSILDDLGKPGEGAAVIDSALKRWPYNQNLLFNLSVCLVNMNQLEKAERVLLKSISINPYHKGSHLALAKVNLYMGRTCQAYLAFNMAVLLNPSVNYISQYENAIFGKYDALIHPYLHPYPNTADSTRWKDLAIILNSGVPYSEDFDFPFKPDFKVLRMSLVLFRSISYLNDDTCFYNQFYARFFSQMLKEHGFEVFLNHCLQNAGNEQVKGWMDKHKGQYEKFVNWAQTSINTWKEHGFSYRDEISGITRYHYSEKGSLEAIGELKSQTGKKSGEWVTLNGNGGLDGLGIYTDGKKTGPWTIYWPTATVKQKLFYTNDSLDGTCYTYFGNGVKSGTYHFILGKEDGREEHYSSTGLLNKVLTYSMDSVEGPAMIRDMENWLERKYINKANKVDGAVSEFWLSGVRKFAGSYKDGMRNGIRKYWYPNDSLESVENYINDTLRGAFIEYYQNGKKLKEGMYDKEGRLQGILRTFTRDGKIFSIDSSYNGGNFTGTHSVYYRSGLNKEVLSEKDNIPTEVKSYDSTGRMIYKAEVVNGILRYKEFYPDGRLLTEGDLVNGKRKGEWITYGASGLKLKSFTYVDDMLTGPQLTYHKTGSLKEKYDCDSNRIVGLYIQYNQNGKVKSKGNYRPLSAYGDWYSYYPDDSVETISYLINGHPAGRIINKSLSNKTESEMFFEDDGTETRTIFYDGKENITCDYNYLFGESKGIDRYSNGTIHHIVNMCDNQRNGNYEKYYPNGKLCQQVPFCFGKIDGVLKSWDPQGNLINEISYIMGNRNGLQKLYTNGKLIETSQYEDNDLEGTDMDYDENGKLARVIEWSGNKREGNSDYYAPDGSMMYRVIYWSDLIVGYTYLGPDGKLLPIKPVTSETSVISANYRNGMPSLKAGLKSGYYHGNFTSWYPDGSFMKEATYVEDNEEGLYKAWNQLKKPLETITFTGGYRNGPYISYHSNGSVRLRGMYYFDEEDGDWELYDENCKQIAIYKYDRGNLYENKTF